MAQSDNKEETGLQVPESLPICVNNCASPTAAAPLSPPSNPTQSKFRSESDPVISSPSVPDSTAEIEIKPVESVTPPPAMAAGPGRPPVNRCFRCRKRVGLTGFRCRCGDLFCGDHRYSGEHGCSFDYKAAGREAISRENPVVRAAKIVRF